MHPHPQTAGITNYKMGFLIKKSQNPHKNRVFKLIQVLAAKMYFCIPIPLFIF